MSEITLIGLGAMGTAIANALLKKNCDLTVWNRSPEKMKSVQGLGAKTNQSLKEAITSSQIIIICIHGYEATQSLLEQPGPGTRPSTGGFSLGWIRRQSANRSGDQALAGRRAGLARSLAA